MKRHLLLLFALLLLISGGMLAQNCTIQVYANPNVGGSPYVGDTVGTTIATYIYGKQCIVHAHPSQGYNFIKWTENTTQVSTLEDFEFTVDSDRTLCAHFTLKNYNINVSADPASGGNVSGSGSYDHGQSCTVVAIAASGFIFANWTENDSVVSNNTSYTFRVYDNRNLVAHFEPLPQTSYTITVSATDGGSAHVGDDPDAAEGSFSEGQLCTVHAVADEGYSFLHWTENNEPIQDTDAGEDYTFEVTRDRNLVAHFEPLPQTSYTITATAVPSDGGTINDSSYFTQTYSENETCTLTATANEGYRFVYWAENGHEVHHDSTYSFTVDSNRELTAYFEKTSCIDDLQAIQPKFHTEDNDTYIMILVYPNPNDEKYEYQWRYSFDDTNYSNLNIGTYNKQYYYKGGRLNEGYYKVRVSKNGCYDETEAYYISGSHLRIYPNPSNRGNKIVIMNDCNGPALLTLYSIDGRLLHTQTVTDNQATLDISLPQGVYVAYLANSEGYTKVGKLVIQ